LLSFSKNRDKKVYQKSLFLRVVLEGEHDPTVQIQHNAMYETISKAVTTTLANYNEVLLNGITNDIKEAFSLDIQNGGPTYCVPIGIGKHLLDRLWEIICLENKQTGVNAATLFNSQCNSRYWTMLQNCSS
jgi:hypothetical protein